MSSTSTATPETILAKILRSSRAIKQILVIDSVGLVIAKVLRTKPIEGVGALEASIFRSTEDIVKFIDLGKSVLHFSVFSENAIMGLDIGIGILVLVLDYNTRWVLDAELIESAIKELINIWVNQLGLKDHDFSIINKIGKVISLLYQGDRVPPYTVDESSFDIIQDLFSSIKNPSVFANCITNELGLSIAYVCREDFQMEGEELGGTLLAVDSIAKEKGENAGLGSPIFSAVFTDQNKGFLTAHAGSLEGEEPLVYMTLFDLKNGFVSILSEAKNMLKNIATEYADNLTQVLLTTIDNIFRQMFPEERAIEEGIPAQKMTELSNMYGEIEKNIDDSITYYMSMLGEFMELISSRVSEIQNSLSAYDQDLRKWIQDNIPIFKNTPLEKNMEEQMLKWTNAKEVVENKINRISGLQ